MATNYIAPIDAEHVKNVLNKFIDHVAHPGNSKHFHLAKEHVWRPRMELSQCTESNTVVAMLEMPGIPKSNISVTVVGRNLRVTAERRLEQNENYKALVNEIRYGKYVKVIPLSQTLEASQISASMDEGILTLCWPVASEEEELVPMTVDIA